MSFEQPSERSDSAGLASDNVTLRLLQKALRAEPGFAGAIYTHDRAGLHYTISSSFGIEPELVDRVRDDLVFTVGDPRGLVGHVANTREAEYLPDFEEKASWFNAKGVIHVGSVYIVPVVSGPGLPAIITVISQSRGAFPPDLRSAIDSLARFAGSVLGIETTMRSRVRAIERGLRSARVEWAEVLGLFDAEPAGDGRDQLRTLSPREWDVVEALHEGKRVATIAHELDISQNTVRNHAKSICRKLGAASQDELREYIGKLKVAVRASPLRQLERGN